MKYTKYGIVFGLLTVLTGIIVTLLIGYRPAPKPVMKPSFFDTPAEIGEVALRYFYAPLESESIVILGVPSNRDWSTPLVSGFIQAANQNSRIFTHVVIERQMQNELRTEVKRLVPTALEIESNSEGLVELTEAVLSANKSNHRLLVIVPNLYSTHLLSGNVIHRLETAQADVFAKPFFSITVTPLALRASDEKGLDPICLGSERDGSGTVDLGCAILQAGRYFYRKRILDKQPNAQQRFIAIMQSSKVRDYMLLVRDPAVGN